MSASDTTEVLFRRMPAGLDRPRIERFARALRRRVARSGFTCLITTDAEMRRLNLRLRGRDYPADVLSFVGEMAISAPRARAQAAACGHTLEEEIEILMLHGVLHLNGMDHESDNGEMRRAEVRWRRKLGLPDSLIERQSPAGGAAGPIPRRAKRGARPIERQHPTANLREARSWLTPGRRSRPNSRPTEPSAQSSKLGQPPTPNRRSRWRNPHPPSPTSTTC